MRVLFAITRGEVGGAQEHVRLLAMGLIRAGHEVGLVAEQPSELADQLGDAGATVLAWASIRREVNPLADLRARSELRAHVEAWKPQILHLNSSKAGVAGVGLLTPPSGATVFTCHHAPFGPGRLWRDRVVARPVMQLALPRFQGIISVGERDVPAITRIAPLVPVQVVPNAVPAPPEPASAGQLVPSALWVARMAHPKDPGLMVRAWEQVVRRIPDARLTMCGTGPLTESLRRQIAASDAHSRIDYPGFVADLGPYRSRASVFVLPTNVEGGLTMATLEAMVNGLVPVVSDAGDALLLEQMHCGVVVGRNTPEAFADALCTLFSDPGRYAELRRNALAYARHTRTPSHVVAETVDFYRRVLSGAGMTDTALAR